MLERQSDSLDPAHQQQRDKALLRSQSQAGAGSVPSEVPPLSNAELVQLHVRVIALENLVIAAGRCV